MPQIKTSFSQYLLFKNFKREAESKIVEAIKIYKENPTQANKQEIIKILKNSNTEQNLSDLIYLTLKFKTFSRATI